MAPSRQLCKLRQLVTASDAPAQFRLCGEVPTLPTMWELSANRTETLDEGG